jgi:hypothetical protein
LGDGSTLEQPSRFPALGMTERYSQRISGITGRGDVRETKEKAHHRLNLLFSRAAVSDHSHFDFQRRVLADREAVLRRNGLPIVERL